MKQLIARKRVPYNGKYREVGTVFSAKDKHAHVLVTIGKCDYYQEDLETPDETENQSTVDDNDTPDPSASESSDETTGEVESND